MVAILHHQAAAACRNQAFKAVVVIVLIESECDDNEDDGDDDDTKKKLLPQSIRERLAKSRTPWGLGGGRGLQRILIRFLWIFYRARTNAGRSSRCTPHHGCGPAPPDRCGLPQ